MPEVRVSFHLPYPLALESGEYPTPAHGGSIHLRRILANVSNPNAEQLVVSILFQVDDQAGTETLCRQGL